MKVFIRVLLILAGTLLACDQNCYLGAGLYSAPLDSKGCCMLELDPNCFSYMTLGQNRFVCRQCQLGFRWDNDKCIKFADNEVCVNPDIVSSDYVLCKVCKIGAKPYIPVENTVKGKKSITCHGVDASSPQGLKLRNCMASALHNGVVFCHQCAPGYYYDGLDQQCLSQTTCKEMNGCMLSFVKQKCDLCRHEYQYNMFTYTCEERKVRIDYQKMHAQMEIKMQKATQMEQQLRSNPSTAGMVAGFDGSSSFQRFPGPPGLGNAPRQSATLVPRGSTNRIGSF
jgi:hypothetical protein